MDDEKSSGLREVATRLTAPGKGILASDESTGTIGRRLEKVGLENTEVKTPFNTTASITRKKFRLMRRGQLVALRLAFTCRISEKCTGSSSTPLA
jgi:hypothetical protein